MGSASRTDTTSDRPPRPHHRPRPGNPGTVYRGTYREHATGNFLVINDQDVPHPAAFYYLHGTGTGSDGSQIRLTIRGHFVLDKRTGQVRRNTIISTCHVS